MTGNREFRELQVSSTQLAVIFLGILVIGVVIFLLGVSVGKRHAQVAEKANVIASKQAEKIEPKITLPLAKPEQVPAKEPAKSDLLPAPEKKEPSAAAKLKVEPKKETPNEGAREGPQVSTEKKDLYYVQVRALAEKQAALSTAQIFMRQGYPVVVMDPLPTDKNRVYRVRIGGYATKEEAEVTRAKLAAAAGRKVDYFVVRY